MKILYFDIYVILIMMFSMVYVSNEDEMTYKVKAGFNFLLVACANVVIN